MKRSEGEGRMHAASPVPPLSLPKSEEPALLLLLLAFHPGLELASRLKLLTQAPNAQCTGLRGSFNALECILLAAIYRACLPVYIRQPFFQQLFRCTCDEMNSDNKGSSNQLGLKFKSSHRRNGHEP
jgi:hypothetical protein